MRPQYSTRCVRSQPLTKRSEEYVFCSSDVKIGSSILFTVALSTVRCGQVVDENSSLIHCTNHSLDGAVVSLDALSYCYSGLNLCGCMTFQRSTSNKPRTLLEQSVARVM